MSNEIVPVSRIESKPDVSIEQLRRMLSLCEPPALIVDASPFAQFGYAEFFSASINNAHTKKNYKRAVDRFLNWLDERGLDLTTVNAPIVSDYLDNHLHKKNGQPLADPSKKAHLAALKHFFDHLERRHGVMLNPAAAVRGPKYSVRKGKTTPFKDGQVKDMLKAIDTSHVVGKRDRALLGVLHFTAARAGAVAKLTLGDIVRDGERWHLDFGEKGGKEHRVMVAYELQIYLQDYIDAAGIAHKPKDWPLFRSAAGKTKRLTDYQAPDPSTKTKAVGTLNGNDVLRLVKRRLKDAGLPPETFTPHSFRAATATSLRKKDVPRDRVQYLLGHADARTTALYDHSEDEDAHEIVDQITL